MRSPAKHCGRLALACVLTSLASAAYGATIEVAPTDSYAKIEAAKPGDEVIIDPGTYKFRVYLQTKATTAQPIIIHAKDPTNPPVWDLSAGNVEAAPGSYTAGDRGRGCWQFSGAENIQVSDIVITGCHTASFNSAGVRYYSASKGIRLSNVVFRDNDNGLTGGSQDSEITVEFCEFDKNGNLNASSSSPSHNIYIYGGTFTLRYSYAHDPIQGQNFHIRAHDAVIEYNWFSRAKSYEGDLMTDDDNDGTTAATQNMTLRGNVIVQGSTQSNTSQIVAVYNDAGAANLTLNVKLLYNTFVGTTGGRGALVHLSNADATVMSAELDNNIVFGTSKSTAVEDTAHGKVTGQNNWLMTGADATGLTGSVTGTDPKFTSAAQNDFTLAAGSTAIGAALTSIAGLPDHEYYKDETVTREYRLRATAKDIGAFESTTQGAGVGPGGGTATGGTSGGTGGTTGGTGGGTGGSTGGTSSAPRPTGGIPTTGGTSANSTPTGGTRSTGGTSSSATPTGGTRTTGGTSSSTTPTGGVSTTGGTLANSTPTGGVATTGGTTSSGVASGGAGSGATTAGAPTGGSTSSTSGGAASSGGSNVGGTTTTGGTSGTSSVRGTSGCGCRLAGRERAGTRWGGLLLLVAAVAGVSFRRRSLSRRCARLGAAGEWNPPKRS
jgi:hypothetical protein